MAQNAPPFKTNRSSDRSRTFTGVQDLQAVVGVPDFGPQRCLVIGDPTTDTVTFITEDGASLVVPASSSGTPVTVPVVEIDAMAGTPTVLAHWWTTPSKGDYDYGPYTPNPAP